MIAQLQFHMEKERKGKRMDSEQLFSGGPSSPPLWGKRQKVACWTLCVFLFFMFRFSPILLLYNFISSNRLAPNLLQWYEVELGLGKESRTCTRLCSWPFASCELAVALVDGRNAAKPRACKLHDFIRFSERERKSVLFSRWLGLSPIFFFLGEHPVSVCDGEREGWLCPLSPPQRAAQWKLDFIFPGTKQSQPKPEIIITEESCLGSFHQPGEQLVWDFLKHFFMAWQF